MLRFIFPIFLIVSQLGFAESWSTPQAITDHPVWPYASSVALDPQGNAVSVFTRFYLDEETLLRWVEASVKLAGGTWLKPIALSSKSNAEVGIISPQVKVDDDGNAIALWNFPAGNEESPWDKEVLQYALLPFGSAQWTTLSSLASDMNLEGGPFLYIDKHGSILAVWACWRNGKDYLESARLNKGKSKWVYNTPVELSEQLTGMIMHVNEAGQAWLIWHDGTFLSGTNVIVATLKPRGTKWSKPEVIVSEEGINYSNARIASDTHGNVLATWQEYNIDSPSLQFASYQRLKGSKAWTQTAFQNVETHIYSRGWLSLDPLGNALFIWYPNSRALMSSSLTKGTLTWSPPFLLLNKDLYFSGRIDRKGNRLLTWYDYDEDLLKSSTLAVGMQTWTPQIEIGPYLLQDVQVSSGNSILIFRDSKSLKSIDGTFP